MGSNLQTRVCWDQDTLADCSPEDQVWGWSIRSSEILRYDCTRIDNEVLVNMLYQGILNKKPGSPAWSEPTSIKQGVCLVSNMVVRVIQRCLRMDDKVSNVPDTCLCDVC